MKYGAIVLYPCLHSNCLIYANKCNNKDTVVSTKRFNNIYSFKCQGRRINKVQPVKLIVGGMNAGKQRKLNRLQVTVKLLSKSIAIL